MACGQTKQNQTNIITFKFQKDFKNGLCENDVFFFLLKKQLYRVLMSIKETRPMYMPNLTCGM